jgi:hypothetical protein
LIGSATLDTRYTPGVGDRPDTCPLCGGPNACGLVAGAASCWCYEARIPAAVLARIPAEARGRSCICQTCATGGVAPPTPPREDAQP